jgi:lambda family phage minor tail protein L
MSLQSTLQSGSPGDLVTLFRLDARSVGGDVYYFSQAAEDGAGISFGGVYYTPVDVEFTDMQVNGTGSPPTPKLRVANTNEVFQGLVNTLGDMLGCSVARVRTFYRFLDGKPEADGTAYLGPDIFRIERKSNENQIFIEWELSSAIDQEGRLLPGRQVLRDTCTKRYRYWLTAEEEFDYSKVTCPYTGNAYFDTLGQVVTADKDRCGRRLSDCMLRFGESEPLPFGGFPGAARTRG